MEPKTTIFSSQASWVILWTTAFSSCRQCLKEVFPSFGAKAAMTSRSFLLLIGHLLPCPSIWQFGAHRILFLASNLHQNFHVRTSSLSRYLLPRRLWSTNISISFAHLCISVTQRSCTRPNLTLPSSISHPRMHLSSTFRRFPSEGAGVVLRQQCILEF